MKKYSNPPISEVLVEFYFQDLDWDLAVPGLLYEKIRSEFPSRKSPNFPSITQNQPGAQITGVPRSDRAIFLTADGTKIVQVGPNLLAINHISSYTQWEDFLPVVQRVYKAYCEVVPSNIAARIGIQYINNLRLPIEGDIVRTEDFLDFRPFTGPGLPKDHGVFAMNVQFPFETSAIIVQLGNGSLTTENQFSVILDIKAVNMNYFPSNESEIFTWLENAHKTVVNTFEGCITDKARVLFGGASASK